MSSGPDNNKASLILEDKTVLVGTSFGNQDAAVAGEVVFNTGMVGYPEALTDPSYKGQILVLTYPLTGNYGVPEMKEDEFGLPVGFESKKIQVAGLIVSEYSAGYSHHKATRNLSKWLEDEGIPALYNVDTRALTKKLRDKGSMLGKIETKDHTATIYDPNAVNLASTVCVSKVLNRSSVKSRSEIASGKNAPKVILLDCGCKANIVRSLLKRGLDVIQVPHDYYFLNMDFDGLLISNGPGDPQMYRTAIENVRRALALNKPIFGICLGHQILSLAIGAETYKLKFGHRGHNQPCIEHVTDDSQQSIIIEKSRMASNGNTATTTGRCFITSQNHGYAVRKEGLPSDWRIWFTNANDNTIEGIRHVTKPFSSVQFHPEATPGPVDTAGLFDDFAQQVKCSDSILQKQY